MLFEIFAWTTCIFGTSLVLPYVVPYLRNKIKQLQSIPTTVFDNLCINDVHQAEYNAIDRTVGQIMSATCQVLITVAAAVDLITPIHSLTPFVISYYLYDILHLCIKPYGKTKRHYLIHHAGTIILVTYGHLIQSPYKICINIFYILLESSAATTNIVTSLTHAYPASQYTIPLSFINVVIYGTTRILLYPIHLGYYIYLVRNSTDSHQLYYIFPACSLIILYGVCVNWFAAIVAKHRQMKLKQIL